MNHQKCNNNQFSFQTLNSCLQFPMSSDEVTSFFPDISVITDDKNPSPRNANASCISAITFDDSETVVSANRLRPKSISSECSKQFRSKDEPLSKRILGVYSIVKNDESSNSFHRMMSMVDALDSKKLSEDESCHKSSLVKDSSLYSRILSGLQEMEVDEPKDISRGNFEMEEQEDREVVEEHSTDSKNNAVDTASSSNADGNNDNDEDSITEEIEEQVEEFEDTLSAEGSTASNTDMQQIISSSCCSPSFLKKQQDVSESTRRKNMKEQQQQQELRELAEQQEESQADQWREVFDDRTGRIYYYNRRTRESRWDLPTNSIVVGRRLQVCSSSNRSQQTSAEYSLRDVSMSEMTSNEYGNTIEAMDANQDFGSFQTIASVQHNDTAQSSSQPILNQCDIIHNQHKSLSSPSGVISSTWDHGIVTQTSHDDGYEQDQIPQDNSTAKKKQQCDFGHGGIRYVRSHFFCMYCGTEVATANAMKQHLHLNCHEYSRMSQEDPEEHALLQSILSGVWSSYGHRAHQFVEESDKENHNPHFDHQQCNNNTKQYHCHHRQRNTNHLEVPGPSSYKLEISQNTNSSMISTTNSSVNDRSTGQHHTRHDESIFTLSDEEDTLLDLDFFQHYKKRTTTRSKNRGNNNNSTPPTSPSIRSSCAFCGKFFRSGDKLSRHLLLCKERQRSSKKRAISFSKNKEVGAKVTAATTITTTRVTPQGKTSSFAKTNSIQSHLLTCSGRRLPGYPPITK